MINIFKMLKFTMFMFSCFGFASNIDSKQWLDTEKEYTQYKMQLGSIRLTKFFYKRNYY